MAWLLLIPPLALFASLGAAEDARIESTDSIPDWASDVALQMTLSSMGGEPHPYQYFLVPLAMSTKIEPAEDANTIMIEGSMFHVDTANFDQEHDAAPEEIAYLSCDEPGGDSQITPSDMINGIMETRPLAIVLYSLAGNGCTLQGADLGYESIFTMVDSGDAQQALDFVNGTTASDIIHVKISGNITEVSAESGGTRGTTSAVAMSVLYSITGLVTLLFLIIIGTGTVRAHRHPERYGLRNANGDRPRQSRAKGIARAVLDTLPIIKFGASQPPAKRDPDLETQAPGESQRSSWAGSGEPQTRGIPTLTITATTPVASTSPTAIPLAPLAEAETAKGGSKFDPSAGVTQVPEDSGSPSCTICTDDFNVGEDVRVLPCSHAFHPDCVDPWLMNVSGTCPLCRLDLRPHDERDETLGDDASMPPPLEFDGPHDDVGLNSQRRRVSRFLDLARLRHASPEERIQALRQYRRSQAQDVPATDEDCSDGGRRTRLTDRLREKFRIRTRPQSPDQS